MSKIYSLMLEARALSRQMQVKVAARNIGTAATSGVEVFFDPRWLVTDRPEYVPILRGLLDHEVVGHNLHTDFSVGVNSKDASQVRRSAYAILEDLRIETAAMKVYPGTGVNLSNCVQAMAQFTDIFGPECPGPVDFIDPMAVLANFLLINGRCLISPGQEKALRTRATAWKDEATRLFGPQAVRQCLDLCKQALTAPNTAAIWDLSGDLEKIFKDLAKGRKPQQQQGSQSGEPDADSQNNGQGEDDDDSGEPVGAGSDAQGSGDQGQSSAKHGNDSGESGPPSPGAASGSGSGYSETPGPTPEQIEAAKDALRGSSRAPEVDLGDAIKKALGAAQKKLEDEISRKSCDPFVIRQNKPLDGKSRDDPRLTAILKNRIGRDLDTLIETMSRRWNERAYTGRRVDSRALPGMAWGNTQIFRRKHEEEAIDTAVYFLIDGSASMSEIMRGREINVSRACASFSVLKALGDLLNEADVPFGCAFFASAYCEVKAFDTPWRVACKQMRNVWGGSTVLEPAVRNALSEICIRPEQRKLFILITDGEVVEMAADMVLSDIKLVSHRFGVETATIMLTQSPSSAFVNTLRKNGLRADIIQDPEKLGQHVMDAVKHAIVD